MANRVTLIGRKPINKIVSADDKVQRAVGRNARLIKGRAEALLAGHRQTGEHQIEMQKNYDEDYGYLDYEISLVGEAALSVEFGHIHNFSGRWVNGLYIITRAAGLI